jgi:5-methylcytosine-specific restriction endonuclease McrA
MPKNAALLHDVIGTNPAVWNKNCLVPYPKEFDQQIDLVAEAVQIAQSSPGMAREIAQSLDAEPMKRWFIDVALWSGAWRAEILGNHKKAGRGLGVRKIVSQTKLDELFARDKWRCRYCGIRVAGNRKHFKKFANAIGMPELIAGRSDESRHGLYLMLMASYDHVKPVNQEGTNDSTNLVTACWSCQFGKYKYSLDDLGLNGPIDPELVKSDSWVGLDSKSGK